MATKAIISDINGNKYEFFYEGKIKINDEMFYIFSNEERKAKEVAIFKKLKNEKYYCVNDMELCKNIIKKFFEKLLIENV